MDFKSPVKKDCNELCKVGREKGGQEHAIILKGGVLVGLGSKINYLT